MKVDKRQYTKTEPRVNSVDLRGPLFVGGYSEKYSPPYLSVRTKDFFCGNLRNLRINDKHVEWLTPRSTGLASATPEIRRFATGETTATNNFRLFPDAPTTSTKRTFDSFSTTSRSTQPFSVSSNFDAYQWSNKILSQDFIRDVFGTGSLHLFFFWHNKRRTTAFLFFSAFRLCYSSSFVIFIFIHCSSFG